MKLDFEKFLNENGLKIGDKIKLQNGEMCKIYQSENGEIILKSSIVGCNVYDLKTLGIYDFEKIESKKVGDLICDDMNVGNVGCDKCPLKCIICEGNYNSTLKENLEKTLKTYPELEPMREYFEKEFDKEVEE